MDPLYQQLQQENEDLQRALGSLEKHLETTIAEKEQVSALYQDFKLHYESMKNECAQYAKRLSEEMQARKELEINQEQRLSDMKRAIEMKQRDIEQMQAKMTLPIDTDIMRMKIQKDIEARHRIEIDQKQMEIERLSEGYYEAKRQLDIVKTHLETSKYEHEKELGDLKDKHRHELHEMMIENQALQSKADDKRDRELIRQLRRDLDEHKRRTTDLLSECGDLRRERDLLKLEKNEQMIQFTKDLEEERNAKRSIHSELDRVSFKFSVQDQEMQKIYLKQEKKASEIHILHSEKNSQTALLREKDQLIDNLQKQVVQLKEDMRLRDLEVGQMLKKYQDEEKERQTQERKEKSKLQKDYEALERKYLEIESQRKNDLMQQQGEFERLQRDYRVLQEERKIVTNKTQEIQHEHEALRSQLEKKNEDCEVIERELRKLQDKYREALANEYKLATDRDHLEASLRVAQEEVAKFNAQYEENILAFKKERSDLHNKIQELIAQSEKLKYDSGKQISTYKSKYQDYKTKLKKANSNIQTLATRVAKYELQLAAERDDLMSGRDKENHQEFNMMGMIPQDDRLKLEISKLLEEHKQSQY